MINEQITLLFNGTGIENFIGCLKIRFILQTSSIFVILLPLALTFGTSATFDHISVESLSVSVTEVLCVFVQGFKEFRVRVDVQVCGPQNIASEIFRLAHARVRS